MGEQDMWADVSETPAQRIIDAMNRNRSILSQFIIIMLGAGVNFSVGFILIIGSLNALIASQGGVLFQSGSLPSQVSILAGSYFLIGALYSLIASLTQKPKLIVNPLYIQAVTASFIPFFVFYLILQLGISTSFVDAMLDALGVFFISLAMFVSAGLAQLLLVRYLVGLNGSKEDTRWMTLVLHARLEAVLKVLKTQDVYTAFRISLQRTRKNKLIVLRTNYNANEQFYLLAMKDPKDENKTQLATVAYKQGFYSISAGGVQVLDEMRKSELQRIFERAGIRYSDEETPEALFEAYNIALEPTQARLLTFKSVEPHVKYISGGIALMFTVMTTLLLTKYINLDLYESFIIFGGLSLLLEFIPLFSRRVTKEKD
jgi:hypothetical protein